MRQGAELGACVALVAGALAGSEGSLALGTLASRYGTELRAADCLAEVRAALLRCAGPVAAGALAKLDAQTNG